MSNKIDGNIVAATAMAGNHRNYSFLFISQVLKLLDSIEMPQYKQSFSTQQVTGLVLTMVDEEMLRDDLNVTSKLHRVRLLKVASGEVPILGGKDSKYVKFSR